VTEISGQNRKTPLDVATGTIPTHQRFHSKSVPKIVYPWPVTGVLTAQANFAGQFVEYFVNLTCIYTVPRPGDEKVRENSIENAIAVADVARENFQSRSMKRHQTRFAKFGPLDNEQPLRQINIIRSRTSLPR